MNRKQKVLVMHALTLDNQFIEELASRVIINRKQAHQLKSKEELERFELLFSYLRQTQKPRLQSAMADVFQSTHQSFLKNLIDNLDTDDDDGDEDRHLLLKLQKKRPELKQHLTNPNQIIDALKQKDVLNDEQLKNITGTAETEGQINRLLNAVVRQGTDAIKEFILALMENGYAKLASEIKQLEVDEAGQIMDPAVVYINIRLLERRANQEPLLMDMPRELNSTFQDMFKAPHPIGQKYKLSYLGCSRGPFILQVKKKPGYQRKVFLDDLLNKEVARAMEKEMAKSTFIKRTKKKLNVLLDINIDQLKNLDGSAEAAAPAAENMDEASEDSEEEEDNEVCGCDGDGSCVEPILNNWRATVGNSSRSEVIHKTLVEMVKKHGMQRGVKQFVHSAYEIYSLIEKNIATMSFDAIKRNAPLTVLHVSILEGREDVVQVLFECGIYREFKDVTVKDERSMFRGKTIEEMVATPAMVRVREKLKKVQEIEKSFNWLHRSAQIGQLECVMLVMDRHPHLLHQQDKEKGSTLYWAVTSGHLEVIKALVSAGASLEGGVPPGETLLTRAVSFGHKEVARYLIQEHACNMGQRGSEQKSPIQWAITRSDVAMLRMLLTEGAHADAILTMDVARMGSVALMNALKDHGAFELNFKESDGRTPLLVAVEKGHLPLAKVLVDSGANLDDVDNQKRNVLHKGSESKNREMLIFLCDLMKERGCLNSVLNKQDLYLGQERCFVVRGRDNGIHAFHYVEVERRYMNVFRQITRDGGSIDVARYGYTFRSGWGVNPTQETAQDVEQRYDLSRLNAASPPDLTPLNLSILREYPEGAETLLMKYDADVNITDCFKMTPLHMAAMRGYFDLTRMLVEKKNADWGATNEQGQTAAQVAEDNRHLNIYNYLEGKKQIDAQPVQQFRLKLEETSKELSSEALEKIRQEGEDVQRKIIHKARYLQEEINNLLFALGNTAIQEESSVN